MAFSQEKTRLQKVRDRLRSEKQSHNPPEGGSARRDVGSGTFNLSIPRLFLRMFHYALWVFGVIMMLAWYFFFGPSSGAHGSAYNRQENAVWAPHSWSEEFHTPEEIRGFVEGLGAHGVRYVFLHVGPAESNGTIPPERYAALGEFLKISRQYGDRIKFLAWIGQIRGKLPLQDIQVRQRLVQTSRIFVDDFGMDGIHYDIEPVVDGDSDFVFLLEDTKKAIGEGKILSVALPEMIPEYVFHIARRFMNLKSFLSSEMYRKIAERSDQLAVMTYENSIKTGWAYQYFLKNEIIWLTQLLHDQKHKILIGLPTYDKPTDTFNPKAENIYFGLRGVVDGLNNWRSNKEPFQGVALYGSWTTDEQEWKTLETLFLKKP